ncbi:hypothetical protein EJ04DRAFT_502097 [Polyplosphaeria fusca]|uniref:N-acetyltransferase domain-containing protein n=1 Tax=Polyplosphaeria fusca TaxID=682080 RepID=A0A9P4UV45_9PLEO|nr:hypothetical protein EJ04DRAFT_502097 [Polyplosphaeria fusca]
MAMFIFDEVTSDADFDELIALLWLSYSRPRIPLLPLLFPADEADPDGRAKAIETSKRMLLLAHHADPTGHWFKVTCSDTGKIVGGCRWHVNESNPYQTGAKLVDQVDAASNETYQAPTYETGVAQEFASLILGQMLNPRARRYVRPHTHLHICFVHPDYRLKGVGTLLTTWGVEKADELQIESFIEASDMGRGLYQRFGFVVVSTDHANAERESPPEQWEALTKKFLPYFWHCMWRPVGGNFIEGETKMPW